MLFETVGNSFSFNLADNLRIFYNFDISEDDSIFLKILSQGNGNVRPIIFLKIYMIIPLRPTDINLMNLQIFLPLISIGSRNDTAPIGDTSFLDPPLVQSIMQITAISYKDLG